MRSQNARMASGVYPRRRSPASVGMRGSSQPAHVPALDQLLQLALGQRHVREVQARELGLVRPRVEAGVWSRNQS